MNQPHSSSPTATTRPRVAMVQDGARRHYALPKTLERLGMLEVMYSDWFVRPASKEALLARTMMWLKPSIGRALAERRCDAIPPSKVVHSTALTFRLRRARRRFESLGDFFAWEADARGEWIRKHWRGSPDALLGFVRNLSPELCAWARQRGIATVGDQIIAPAVIENREMTLQQQRWPAWEKKTEVAHDVTEELESRTWPELSHIICMSEYVRDGLRELGIDDRRISVIAYPFDASPFVVPNRLGRTGPVTVGFTGTLGLRKGVPYFLEVAKRFRPDQVRFVMVGGSQLEPVAMTELAKHVELVGRQSRAEVRQWLETFDAFLFPSTCEGSAGSVMEAMAAGLPTITTYNSGSQVRNGIDGFIVKYDDIDGMCRRIEELACSADKRREMGLLARQRIEAFDLDWYGRELSALLARLV